VCVTPRHSRTRRVPGFKAIGGAGLTLLPETIAEYVGEDHGEPPNYSSDDTFIVARLGRGRPSDLT
jgi:hypothetical protein